MKTKTFVSLPIVIIFAVLCSIGPILNYKAKPPVVKNHPTFLQVRASHMLGFVDKDDEAIGTCTGSALGPHSVLTAAHCLESGDIAAVNIDLSTKEYHLLAAATDGRDHVIFLVDGPAFRDICPYVVRSPKIGEEIQVFGFGHEVYPAVDKYGRVIDAYDPSEVDAGQHLFHFSAGIVPGDSGAAIFALDGTLLGLVTYREPSGGSGFELNFTPEQIHAAQTFEGNLE